MANPRSEVRGRWCAARLLLLLTGLLAPGGAAQGQYIPPVSAPTCVSGCEEQRPASTAGGNAGSSGPGLFERLARWREEAAARRRAEARTQNQQGMAASQRGDLAAALRLFRQAEENDPDDAAIRQNVRGAEAALAAQQEAQRRQAALRQEQEAFRQEARRLAAQMPVIRVVPPASAASTSRARVPPPGFPAERWREYLAAQEAVDLLYGRLDRAGVLTDAEAELFFQALQRRNALWAEGQARPLDGADRERLRLRLPVVAGRPPPPVEARPAPEELRPSPELSPADTLTLSFVSDRMSDQLSTAGEDQVGAWLKATRGKKAPGHFMRTLGLVRVAVKGAQEGTSEAGAELVDFAISQVPTPYGARAELAVEGGRGYSAVTMRALDRFMVDAMAAVGQPFDPVAFRKRANEDLDRWQKGYGAWATGE